MEDNSAYLIPHTTRSRAAPDCLVGNIEAEGERLRRLYLKSVDKTATDEDFKKLEELLKALTSGYLSNFQIVGQVPFKLREIFEKDMASFSKNISSELATAYQSALDAGSTMKEALIKAQRVLNDGMNTLTSKLTRYDKEFKTWAAFMYYKNEGYNRFLFISEQGEKTCEHCNVHHGKVYAIYELNEESAIPPLHPNCRCELLIMDGFAEMMYNQNKRGFLEYFQRLRGDNEGGIYVLDHDFWYTGQQKNPLTQISLPNGRVILDMSRPLAWGEDPDYYEKLATWSNDYFSGIVRGANEMLDAIISEQEQRGDEKLDSVVNFLDWLSLGIISGFFAGFGQRHKAMVEDPSFLNILNAITIGIAGTAWGAVAPEKPWSLEHWLDIIGTLLVVRGAFKAIKGLSGLGRGTVGTWSDANFASEEKLYQHIGKHQSEFGQITTEQYVQGAVRLLNRKNGRSIRGFVSKDGWLFKYNITTNEFAIGNPNGDISTYFKPVGGIEYWNKQIERFGLGE